VTDLGSGAELTAASHRDWHHCAASRKWRDRSSNSGDLGAMGVALFPGANTAGELQRS